MRHYWGKYNKFRKFSSSSLISVALLLMTSLCSSLKDYLTSKSQLPPRVFWVMTPPPHCNLLRRCIIDGEGSSMFWAWFNYLPDSLCFTPHSFWCCCSTKLDPLFYILLQKFFKNLFLQSCSWWGCINLFFKTYFRNRSDAIALKAICLFHRSFQNWINKTEVVNPCLSTNKQQCNVQNAQN